MKCADPARRARGHRHIGHVEQPDKIGEFVAAAENKMIDVIVGTQLVTKGYHFPT
jgi:primosomal protein N'